MLHQSTVYYCCTYLNHCVTLPSKIPEAPGSLLEVLDLKTASALDGPRPKNRKDKLVRDLRFSRGSKGVSGRSMIVLLLVLELEGRQLLEIIPTLRRY